MRKAVFTRGYGECRERVSSGGTYSRSCLNCRHYFQASGDRGEVCQNPDVLEYDVVAEGGNVCCIKWEPSFKGETPLFHARGRGRLD